MDDCWKERGGDSVFSVWLDGDVYEDFQIISIR